MTKKFNNPVIYSTKCHVPGKVAGSPLLGAMPDPHPFQSSSQNRGSHYV
jgi:hypothetical protein